MSAQRAPVSPPDLAGFTYVDVLGSGGFADVFLYEQHLPKRRVAVKVLLTERMSSGSADEFAVEANVMAMLSTHPAIVTIYQAGVARDGRPYLVMEFCPKPNLQVRYRREPFSVAESLRVGIQVAAAVETAHRAGVLHRDIKPANILVTEYNRPALTDFGIASTTAAAAESAGLSIPWSPPESFLDAPTSDARSDVYALGATVYSLLAGRSPFELPGQRNTGADLIQRIETMALPDLGRADVPVSFTRVLERAMAKRPADRYDSALAFARGLQKVQIELNHSVTPIDILDDGLPEERIEDEDDGLTRVRGVVSIDPATAPGAGPTRPSATTVPASFPAPPPPAPTLPAVEETVRRSGAPQPQAPAAAFGAPGAAIDQTVRRGDIAAAAEPVAPPAPRRRRGWIWTAVIAGALVVVGGIVLAVALPTLVGPAPAPTETPAATSRPQDPVVRTVPKVADLAGAPGADGVTFTWTNADPKEGDGYLWAVATRSGVEPDYALVTEPTVVVPAASGGETCVTVMLRRENGHASDPVTGCAP